MSQYITASNHEIMDQATMTVGYWLHRVKKEIDSEFGEGYAKAHPELVGAALNAAALDQLASWVGIAGQQVSARIADVAFAIENKE